jgi:hypothetical protein
MIGTIENGNAANKLNGRNIRNGWMGGKGYKGGVRVGFININDMYNNDAGKGGVYAHEAYEAK